MIPRYVGYWEAYNVAVMLGSASRARGLNNLGRAIVEACQAQHDRVIFGWDYCDKCGTHHHPRRCPACD